MKTGIYKYNRKGSGFELKRLVAMLLVLIQCASLAFVGAPAAYAEEPEKDAVVVTQPGEPLQDPDEEEVVIEEEDEPEPEPEDEPILEGGTLEADLGDGFAVTLFYEADAGIPAEATLEIRVPELPPEREEDYAPDALYLTENDLAYYEGRMFEALGVTDNDPVFETMLFELRIFDAEGEPVIPACPVEVRIRFPMADSLTAETWSAVSFDETGVFGTKENTTLLGTSGWSDDEGCVMDFEAGELALFGVCSWAKEHLVLRMGNYEIPVFAPACAQVRDEALMFTPEEENLQLEDARSLHVSSNAPYGATALWAVIRLSGGDGAEANEALYSLIGTELCEHLQPSEDEDALIPLGNVNGFALLTLDPDVPLYSDDTLTLTGEAPVGVVVNTEDVFDRYVDFDFASLFEPEPEPEPAPAPKPKLFSKKASMHFMRDAMAEMLTEAVQEQSASAAPVQPAEENRAEQKNYELIGAYDITLSLGEGVFQPKAGHPIRVSITNPGIREDRDLQLWHIHDDNSREQITDFTVEGNTLTFEATGFSVYLIIAEDGTTVVTPQCTYTFYVPLEGGGYIEYGFKDDQGNNVFKQTIKNGDELIVPQPEPEGNRSFAGWYQGTIVSGEVVLEDEPYDFDNIQITEDSVVDLYAVFTDYVEVLFYGQYDEASGTFPLTYTRRVELPEGEQEVTVRIDDVSASYTKSDDGADMAFFGWSYTPISTPGSGLDKKIDDESIVISGQTELYPIFKPIHWLRFYAAQSGQGAVYNAPRYYFEGDAVSDASDPTTDLPTTALDGYRFVGWFIGSSQLTDENGHLFQVVAYEGGVEVVEGLKMYIHKDVTIYAKWEANQQADYRIAIWKQLASDEDGGEKHYEYMEGFTLTGAVDSTVSVPEEYRQMAYSGYSFARCDDPKTVSADGSMVLNVYYDKDEGYSPTGSYKLKFVDSYTGDTLEELTGLAYGTPLAGKTPANPTSTRPGYAFSNWYLDDACTIPADLSAMTMPDHDLKVYAGWELIWYLVKIDPNYGELAGGTGSTWFWQTIEDEPIGEYTYVTRNFEESSSGEYYYVLHDRDYYGYPDTWVEGESDERKSYYTDDPGEATEDKTFESIPGVYTYAGWYEVKNGVEEKEPYVFGRQVDHDTTLRLHWKKNGVYYLAYNAAVTPDGSAIGGTVNNKAEELLPTPYEDYAGITLDRTAVPPSGYTFIGWQVRGDDSGIVYKPGQVLTFRADYAVRIGGKEIVYLDAVYVKLGTASVIYNANGGTLADSGVDFGEKYTGEDWVAAAGTIDTTAGTATVSGLTNNSRFRLSNGNGFTNDDGVFLGWSNRPAYDPDDPGAMFFPKNSEAVYGVDTNDPNLYAVWGLKVTYHLNQTEADWGTGWDDYSYDEGSRTYSRTVFVNNPVEEPSGIPTYTGSAARLFRYWTTAADSDVEYDFSQPVTGALDLYAYWSEPNVIGAHAVDASQDTLDDVTDESGWTVNDVTAGVTAVDFTANSHVTAPSGYAFAFAAAAKDLASVSDRNAVTALRYDSASRCVCVRYEGDTSFTPLEDGQEIWFVYYQEKELPISYRSMASSGVLTTAAVSSDAPDGTGVFGTYDMTASVTQPLGWASGSCSHYAFAIGSQDPGSGEEMNASSMCLITNASDSDDSRPQLQMRNTWKGFEYSTDGGDSWVHCGYDVQPYVIYYEQQPSVVMFRERTVGLDTDAVMGKAFTFNLKVTQTTTTTISVQKQKLIDGNWVDEGEPTGNSPYLLKNGEANTAILFSDGSTQTQTGAPYTEGEDTYQNVTTTTVSAVQTAVITQTSDADFTTAINGVEQTAEPYVFTASSGSAERVDVTFTNTHKAASIEIHLALVASGGIVRSDGARNLAPANCRFDLPLGESEKILTKISKADLYRGEGYAFGDVIYGVGGSDGAVVTGVGMGVVSVAYEQINDNVYGLILKDGNGNRLAVLDGRELYYLYYPMPRIEYVKLGAGGELTPIKGSDGLAVTEAVTYNHAPLYMNNAQLVTQGQRFEISMSDFVIGQSGGDFRMPPVLDDGLYERYLNYALIGAGGASARNVSALSDEPSDGLTMHLRITEAEHASVLQFSYDGQTWRDLPLSGIPTIYAIYTERGYDLQISKALAVPESEKDNPLFDGKSFTVTISSPSITKAEYEAEGAESTTVTATPAAGSEPGTIVLTVVDGTKVKIKALSRGDYTITETDNTNYILTAKAGKIVGTATEVRVTNNSTVTVTLDNEKRVDLTNSPQPLCRIMDNGSEHIFYTLRSAVKYIEDNIADYTATIEMLADYVIPAGDSVEIPSGFNVTLTTAESLGRVSVITRGEDLDDEPIFKNSGSLTLRNITLDGASVSASQSMIESGGALLKLDRGVTVLNAVSSGNGGAITVTAGDLTVNDACLKNNRAAGNGGAVHYSGNGKITISRASDAVDVIHNNEASGSGGAFYVVGGTVEIKEKAVISNNSAGSDGGAICADNAVLTVSDSAKLENNTAGNDGGAICIGGGSVTVSGGSVSKNTATTGSGGAICTGSGSVTVSGGSVTENSAKTSGGAIYSGSGSVTVSGGSVSKNTATDAKGGAIYTGSGNVTVSSGSVTENSAGSDGGAVYAGSGNVTVSGGSVSNNTAVEGSGGAVYAGNGNVTVPGGSVGQNKAGQHGGAVYAGKGAVTISCNTLSGNEAVNGKGGAVFADEGAVNVSGTAVSVNKAKGDGGAIYADKGAVTLDNVTMGGTTADDGNMSTEGSGGAVYAGSGNVTVTGSGTKFQNNTVTAGNGGSLYAGSGVVTVSNAGFTGNKADAGQGGAVYIDSGTLTLTTVSATGNSAVNGAAVFADTGRVTFSAATVTDNTSSAGGAVGVGNKDARLYFVGNAVVNNNTLGSGTEKSNVYLDQDDDAVINIDGIGGSARIGVYVPDKPLAPGSTETLVDTRSVPGARFAIYSSNANVSRNTIFNDRFSSLTVQSDTAAKKLYWGNAVKVEVRYLASYAGGFPPKINNAWAGSSKYTNNSYYPEFDDGAISELAAELYNKYNLNLTASAVYGGAFADNAEVFADYVTRLVWDKERATWTLIGRDGTTPEDLNNRRIVIFYAEPAYIAIENNTAKPLNISSLKVNDNPVINTADVAGYGMVFAKNGAIRSELLPVKAEDLQLDARHSVTLLIPGGRNMAYTLDGGFAEVPAATVRLRRGVDETLDETWIDIAADGSFTEISGTTLDSNGTYRIIFGDDKPICKVVDSAGAEHPYNKISLAIDAIKNGTISLEDPKTATIEMLVDYLLPASDEVVIPQGYDITLTTAVKAGVEFPYTGEGERATISRDSENTNSMINSWNALSGGSVVTTLRLSKLIIDGKSVQGNSDGGAVASQYTNVYIDHVDFKNVYANNGGALLVMFNYNKNNTKDPKHTVAGSILEVRNCDFTGCTSTTTVTSNRLGGGAIVTNAETMTLEDSTFTECTAVDQAGAVFHRIDYNDDSWTTVSGCTFTNCRARAAGGLEIDSKDITVSGCTFEHCQATERNGGGFNVWPLNSGTTSDDCWVKVKNCTFNDCQVTDTKSTGGNGGGFRCAAVYTKVENCTFTNNTGFYGGGFCVSNTNAKTAEIYGCTFERNTANQGGGVLVKAKEVIIGDYVDPDTGIVRHTEIKNCNSKVEGGGGIRHDSDKNLLLLSITNAVITGNEALARGKEGGGVYTKAKEVKIDGATISDNQAAGPGGGLYAQSAASLTISDSSISKNVAGGNGGGVWFDVNNDNTRKNMELTVKGSTFDNNTSGGSGGGIYTLAKKVTIRDSENRTDNSGKPSPTVISNCTAQIGGGVYHDRSIEGSSLTLMNSQVNNCRASAGIGGGIRTNARQMNVSGATISRNTASGDGGGIWYDGTDNTRGLMKLSMEGCTLDGNSSGGNGGGVYTKALEVELKARANGEGEAPDRSTVSNCTAKNGGGIYHYWDKVNSKLTISGSTISGCSADDATSSNVTFGGGGVYGYVRTIRVEDHSEISGNTAVRNGGGILALSENYNLIIDASSVSGNTAGNQGGGIYSRSQLAISGGTEISGNKLSGNTYGNAAGVYLINGRTLTVGTADAATDDSSIHNNTTATGEASNLRLWSNSDGQNNAQSVFVNCPLSGEILVLNANRVGTQFGSSLDPNFPGFTETFHVFQSDHSTLYGIYDRTFFNLGELTRNSGNNARHNYFDRADLF